MTLSKFLFVVAFFFALFPAEAQTEIPKGFTKGTLILTDGTTLSGYVKDYIRRNASVTFIDATEKKKKSYSGNELSSVQIDSTTFLCIKGDFFTVVCAGELSLLQKSSDASGKVSYNGTEPIFINGTEGKPGDYFIYKPNQQLQLLSKKTFDSVIGESFTNCRPAIEKIKMARTDVSIKGDR